LCTAHDRCDDVTRTIVDDGITHRHALRAAEMLARFDSTAVTPILAARVACVRPDRFMDERVPG